MQRIGDTDVSRRDLMIVAGACAATTVMSTSSHAQSQWPVAATVTAPVASRVTINVNGTVRDLELDNRTTLLDALREQMQAAALFSHR